MGPKRMNNETQPALLSGLVPFFQAPAKVVIVKKKKKSRNNPEGIEPVVSPFKACANISGCAQLQPVDGKHTANDGGKMFSSCVAGHQFWQIFEQSFRQSRRRPGKRGAGRAVRCRS